MKGFIYIAGAFETVIRSKCGSGKSSIDNDPHFWEKPPSWGICRNDLRRKTNIGDYIFFVLPKKAKLPQMIFGYMKAENKISHLEAYYRKDLISKRMGPHKNPNGNIIVDKNGHYNIYDKFHKSIFDKIKSEYIVGSINDSKFLSPYEIKKLSPAFLSELIRIIEKNGDRPIDVISRKGFKLSESQVKELIKWLNS